MSSPIWGLLGITEAEANDILRRIQEVKTLYNLSESDMELLQQQAMMLKMTYNLSPDLQLKLLKGLTALTETIMEATKRLQKKDK